jgi:hypothetical protein
MNRDQNARRNQSTKIENIWEKPELIKILFGKKLGGDWSQEMLAIIRRKILCLPICYQKIKMPRNMFLVVWYGCEI